MNKSRYLFLVLSLLVTVIIKGQGIQFEKVSSWKDVLAKAKAENKYVFVDCYTTWCAPCKGMEKEIYPLQSVGDYYNQHFVSIKLQFDKTGNDDALTKKWYGQAGNFQSTYLINAYPTFLFFDTEGNPVHKITGTQNADMFIQIAKDAQNQETQYYRILKNYQPGKLDTAELRGLAISFQYTNKELAGKMVKDYFNRTSKKDWAKKSNLKFLVQMASIQEAGVISSYILLNLKLSSKDKLFLFNSFQNDSLVQSVAFKKLKTLSKVRLAKEENIHLLTIFRNKLQFKTIANKYIVSLSEKEGLIKNNINLMSSFMKTSADKSFSFFLAHPNKIDSVMERRLYAQMNLAGIIIREMVEPAIKNAKEQYEEPNWTAISYEIEDKYGKQYAARCIITAKWIYYQQVKKWNEYAKAVVQYVDTYDEVDPKSAFYLNNIAYSVFENTNDVKLLERANAWMDVALKSDSSAAAFGTYIGTKAEIMYKMGFIKEAINLMNRAIATNKAKNPGRPDAEWYSELEMMKRGEKIWPEKIDGK